jgi:hypothetical protein
MNESVEKHLAQQSPSTLPVAHLPIGKVGRCAFRIQPRDGGVSPAPESLQPKVGVGDGW